MTLPTVVSSRAMAARASRGRSFASRETGVMDRSTGNYTRNPSSSLPPRGAEGNRGAKARARGLGRRQLQRAAVDLDQPLGQRQRQVQPGTPPGELKTVEELRPLAFGILGPPGRARIFDLEDEAA